MDSSGLSSECSIVWSWTSINDLERKLQRHRETLLIEQVGLGRFAIGPSFGTEASVCLDCYLARRRANGATECRPVSDADEVLGLRDARTLIATFLACPSSLGATQTVASDDGVEIHRIFSLPGCPRCRAGVVAWSDDSKLCHDMRLESAVSSRLGLVHKVAVHNIGDDFSLASAVGCRTDAFCDVRALAYGYAADRDPQPARSRAIAEALERYAAAICDPARLLDFADLPAGQTIAIRSNDVRVVDHWAPERWRWVQGSSVAGGAARFVPACLVFLPYAYLDREPRLAIQSSSGLAIGRSKDAGLQHALLELVERDALARAWRTDGRFEVVGEHAQMGGTLYTCLVPCRYSAAVALVLLERDEAPYCAAGIAARADLAEAIAAAEREAIGVFGYLRDLACGASGIGKRRPGNMLRHAFDPSLREARRSRLGARSIRNAETSFPAAALYEELSDAVCVDLTTSDLSILGLNAVRVVAPRLVSLESAEPATTALMPLPVG